MKKFAISRILPIGVCLCLAALQVSCGGGGGGGGKPAPANTATQPGSQTATPQNVNNGAKGTLYFSEIKNYLALDFETGVVTSMRANSWGEAAAPDGKEFALLADGYTFFGPDTDLIVYFGQDGLNTSIAESPDKVDLIGPTRISPNGQYTALYWSYDKVYWDHPSGLAIMNRAGDVLQFIEGDYINDWDWTPDNQLYYNSESTLYRIPQVGSNPVVITQVTDGYPRHLTISKDGSQMLYTVWDDNRKAQDIYTMALDGSNRVKVATSNTNKNQPVWSPDGKAIAIQSLYSEGWVTWDCPSGDCTPMAPIHSECLSVLIVPLGGAVADLTTNNFAPAFPVVMKTGANKFSNVNCASNLSWSDVPRGLASQPGTPVAGNDANYGLTGRMLVENVDVKHNLQMLELSSGNLTNLPSRYNQTLPPNTSAAKDGQEIIFVDGEPDNNSLYEEQLKIESLDGTITSTFNLWDDIQGTPQLSYDGQYILVWRDFDHDDDGESGARIYDRNGNEVKYLGRYGNWNWMADNRVVLTSGTSIYLSNQDWSEINRIAALPNTVYDINVNRQGTSVAFVMTNHVWTMNLDGTNLKQLTTSSEREIGPIWSPDGLHVSVTKYDGFSDSCRKLHAVPADGERVYVGSEGGSTNSQKIWAYQGDGLYDFCQFGYLENSWVP